MTSLALPQLSPMKAIRAKCIDCCGGQVSEVAKCTATRCPLYPLRGGKRQEPRPRTPAQVAASLKNAERMRASRQDRQED